MLRDIVNALVDGDEKRASKLIDKYQIEPTDKAIETEILRRKLARQEWKSVEDLGVKEEWQYQREGVLY